MTLYFDNASSTRLDPEVREAMMPYLSEVFGNPSSLHAEGRRARKALDDARDAVAGLLGANSKEVIFTSSATEADNLALFGVARARRRERRHIIVSSIEHPAVLAPVQRLQEEGFDVSFLPVDAHGIVRRDELRRLLRPDTSLVSVMLVNNEIGTIQPVHDVAALSHEVGAVVHTDAAQACGKIPVRVRDLGVDLATLSAHKMHGPRGAGALYVKMGTPLEPHLWGGGHEFELRAGTENVAAAVGLAMAFKKAVAHREERQERIASLRNRLHQALASRISRTLVNGGESRIAGILNISFEGVDGEAMVIALDQEHICVATGSACASLATEPSHVLAALGHPQERIRSALRFSLSHDNTESEIDLLVGALERLVARLRALSPVWME